MRVVKVHWIGFVVTHIFPRFANFNQTEKNWMGKIIQVTRSRFHSPAGVHLIFFFHFLFCSLPGDVVAIRSSFIIVFRIGVRFLFFLDYFCASIRFGNSSVMQSNNITHRFEKFIGIAQPIKDMCLHVRRGTEKASCIWCQRMRNPRTKSIEHENSKYDYGEQCGCLVRFAHMWMLFVCVCICSCD